MRLAAARTLRSSLRIAMPLKAAWMVTAEADSRVPLAPCKRGRQTLDAGARKETDFGSCGKRGRQTLEAMAG